MPTPMKHEPLKVATIETEIADFIHDLLARKQPVQINWIVQGIIQQHPDLTGADAPWYRIHGYRSTRTMVRSEFRKLNLITESPEASQKVLPGWEHLQQAYTVERDETQYMIPIEQMSHAELLAKAEEYRVMGRGCFAHADELDRYREARAAAA